MKPQLNLLSKAMIASTAMSSVLLCSFPASAATEKAPAAVYVPAADIQVKAAGMPGSSSGGTQKTQPMPGSSSGGTLQPSQAPAAAPPAARK